MVGQVQQSNASAQDSKQKPDADKRIQEGSKPNQTTTTSPPGNRPPAVISLQTNRYQAVTSPQANRPPPMVLAQANPPQSMATAQANPPQAVPSPQVNHPSALASPQTSRPPVVPTPQANRPTAPHPVNRSSPQVHPPMPPHNQSMLPGGIARGPNGQPMIRTPPSAMGQSAIYVQPAQNNAFSVKRTVPFIS